MIVKNQDSRFKCCLLFSIFQKEYLKSTPIRNIFSLQNTDDFPNSVWQYCINQTKYVQGKNAAGGFLGLEFMECVILRMIDEWPSLTRTFCIVVGDLHLCCWTSSMKAQACPPLSFVTSKVPYIPESIHKTFNEIKTALVNIYSTSIKDTDDLVSENERIMRGE